MNKITKYDEGRAAAQARLQRILCGRGEVSPEVTFFVLRDEAAHWRRLLLQQLDTDLPSLPALAYSRGGLDAVEGVWSEQVRRSQPLAQMAA